MLLYALLGVFVVLSLAVEFGFMASPLAGTLIQIRDGVVRVEKGKITAPVLHNVVSILRESAVAEGYIAITGNRVAFSRLIPGEIHQRLRNVLLNHLR